MVTVKQLADEIGVSKVAVNKKIESLGLKGELIKDGNRYLINDAVADKVRGGFKYRASEKSTATENEGQPGQEKKGNDPGNTADIIQVLREQLAEKDRQIERLHTLLAQQNQLMLTDGKGTPGTQEVEAETVEQEEMQTESQEQPPQERRSFWRRLFT